MNVKEKIINNYPLTKRIDCPFECYLVKRNKYVVFYNKKINKDNTESLCYVFSGRIINFPKIWRTLVIVAYTDEDYNACELSYFSEEDSTLVLYYLINEQKKEIYYNDDIVLFRSLNWSKVVKTLNEILGDDYHLLRQKIF